VGSGVPTHLGGLEALPPLVARTIDRFGRLDIVVNNAATPLTMPLGTFAPDGIRVNALAPGSIDTDMMRANALEAQARMAASSLQGRAASPDEMVGPALFLASDAASFVTGQVVIADGGLVPH
jgi:NAD(P)-dependent dehydrogenase (short-subunit alcohol dehydrogenase family)